MSSAPGWRVSRRRSHWPPRGAGCAFTKPATMPAAAAAPISIPSSAAASTTATTCCSPATAGRSTISNRSAPATRLEGPQEAVFAFFDAASGRRWNLRPNRGAVPWWILRRARRVPDTRALDYARGAGAALGRPLGDDHRGARSAAPAVSPAVGAARRRRAEHQRRARLGSAVLAYSGRNARPRRCCVPAAGAARGPVGDVCRSGARNLARAR